MSNFENGPITEMNALNTFTFFSMKQPIDIKCEDGPAHSLEPLLIDPMVHMNIEPPRGRYIKSVVLWTSTVTMGEIEPADLNLRESKIQLLLCPLRGTQMIVNDDYNEYGCLRQPVRFFDLQNQHAKPTLDLINGQVLNGIIYSPNHPAVIWRAHNEPMQDSHKIFMYSSTQDIEYSGNLFERNNEIGFKLNPNKAVEKIIVQLSMRKCRINFRWFNRNINYLNPGLDNTPEEIVLGPSSDEENLENIDPVLNSNGRFRRTYATSSVANRMIFRSIEVLNPRRRRR